MIVSIESNKSTGMNNKHISTFLFSIILHSVHERRQYVDFTLTFLVFSTCIFIMVLSRFPFVPYLYLTLLFVFSDYGIMPFCILEVVIYIHGISI